MLSVPSTDHLCCVELANLVLASLLVVHGVHVLWLLACTTHSHYHCGNAIASWHSIGGFFLLFLNVTVAVGIY